MQLVIHPPGRVGADVLLDIGQFSVIPHNAVVEVPVPKGRTRNQTGIHGRFGDGPFVRVDYHGNRAGNRFSVGSTRLPCGDFAEDPEQNMDMVRHDHERIHFDLGMAGRQIQPCLVGDFAQGIEKHVLVHDAPKHGHPFVGADGDEIRTRPGVIMVGMAQGISPLFHG